MILDQIRQRQDHERKLREPHPPLPAAEAEALIRRICRHTVREEIRLTFQPRGWRGRGFTHDGILNRIRYQRRLHTESIARERAAQ